MALPFVPPTTRDAWFLVGLASSFPNITEPGTFVLGDRVGVPPSCSPPSSPSSAFSSSCSSPSSAPPPSSGALPPPSSFFSSPPPPPPPPPRGCRVFFIPRGGPSSPSEIGLDDLTPDSDLADQVMIFQYRRIFHAVDHKCPHAGFPLSRATPFDIEDFGVALSAGLTCPRHGWSFDLFRGNPDRGRYRLPIWEVELRPVAAAAGRPAESAADADDGSEGMAGKEVWVRRRRRMG